jgi:hypothetical protein
VEELTQLRPQERRLHFMKERSLECLYLQTLIQFQVLKERVALLPNKMCLAVLTVLTEVETALLSMPKLHPCLVTSSKKEE